MARTKKREQFARDTRVGLYIQPETRDRINRLKEAISIRMGKSVSQDDAINTAFDVAEAVCFEGSAP